MARRIQTLSPVAVASLVLVAAGSARAGAFDAFVGSYTGTWFNNMFSSTGSAQLDVAIEGDEVTMTATMGGGVFGIYFDPDPVVIPGTANGDQIEFDATVATFGHVVATITSGGAVSYTLTMIPGTSFMSITGTGTIGSGQWNMDYAIDVMPMGTYDGVVTLAPEPGGATQGMLALAALVGLGRICFRAGRPLRGGPSRRGSPCSLSGPPMPTP